MRRPSKRNEDKSSAQSFYGRIRYTCLSTVRIAWTHVRTRTSAFPDSRTHVIPRAVRPSQLLRQGLLDSPTAKCKLRTFNQYVDAWHSFVNDGVRVRSHRQELNSSSLRRSPALPLLFPSDDTLKLGKRERAYVALSPYSGNGAAG